MAGAENDAPTYATSAVGAWGVELYGARAGAIEDSVSGAEQHEIAGPGTHLNRSSSAGHRASSSASPVRSCLRVDVPGTSHKNTPQGDFEGTELTSQYRR